MDQDRATNIVREIKGIIEQRDGLTPADIFQRLKKFKRSELQEALQIGLHQGSFELDDNFQIATHDRQRVA